jgi:hypothetical protein
MLYDPKWQTKRVYSPESLIGWLETKDPNETYDYSDPKRCLHAQYRLAMGLNDLMGFRSFLMIRHFAIEYRIAAPFPNTFGAALRRAHRVLNVN